MALGFPESLVLRQSQGERGVRREGDGRPEVGRTDKTEKKQDNT